MTDAPMTEQTVGHGATLAVVSEKDAPTQPRTARDAATSLLVRHARRDPDLHPAEIDDTGLAPRDAALAHAIADQAVRRWGTIEYLLSRRLKRSFSAHAPEVRAALLAGAAQLLFFDRLPGYAVVNEAVGFTRERAGRKSAGLVNAVLRRFSEIIAHDEDGRPARREHWTGRRDELPLADGGARALTEDALPEDELERLAVATGLPSALLGRLSQHRAIDEVRRCALHSIANPPVILNTAHASAPLPEDDLEPHSIPGHHVFTGSAAALATLLRSRADLWAQDPASSAAVPLAVGVNPSVVIDACAGRGTKTRQLRAFFPDARILATDRNDDRRHDLSLVFADDPAVSVIAPEGLLDETGAADLILLDVPCSNCGVLGRRPEARRRWSDRTVRSLADTQRQILADSIRLLAPGGAILYTTCSVDPRENEDQLAWLEHWHRLRAVRSEARWPSGGPGAPASASHDGGFAALAR